MREMIEPAMLAVALPRGIDQRQVARLAVPVRRIALAGEIALFQRHGDFLGKSDADKTAGGNGVPVANEPHRFRGRNNLALLRAAQIGQRRMLTHSRSSRMVQSRKARLFRTLPVARLQASALVRVSVAK
jgi:hypothetical protein